MSIQVGRPRLLGSDVGLPEPIDHQWRSAIFKSAIEGPVLLTSTNVMGDRQADPRVHGGTEMAVLCYSADHYPLWRREMGIDEMGPGGFGENFTITGQDERSVCLGDVYEVGEAIVQVSQPRGPCYKISYRWKRPDLLRRVEENGRHGWYLRVLREGMVAAGQAVRLTERPHPDWSVRRAADAYRHRRRDRATALQLAACESFSPKERERILSGR